GGDVGVGAHQLAPFGRRIRRQDLEPLAVEAVVGERETRAFVDGSVIVDDGNLPSARRSILRNGLRVVDQVEDIVLFGHCAVPSPKVSSVVSPPLAVRGMIMRNVVPCPSLDSSIMRPPSCWVTRLYTI